MKLFRSMKDVFPVCSRLTFASVKEMLLRHVRTLMVWALIAGLFSFTNQMEARPVASVSAGGSHTMFILSDGTLWGTGANYFGQLSDASARSNQYSPVQVSSGNYVASVSAGRSHTMYLKANGGLFAMGLNQEGQLGDGTSVTPEPIGMPPIFVANGVASVAAGGSHTMFIKTDGTLWAMGANFYGQLGAASTTGSDHSHSPVQVATDVVSISAGSDHSMFIKTDGTLWAMGYNNAGQLGDGTSVDRNRPVQVASGVASVSAGANHTMFVKTDGTFWAMGNNSHGELGDGTTTTRLTPVQVMSGVVSVSAGDSHTMFLKTDGTLWATGSNTYGQLGDGTKVNKSVPVQVASGVISVSAGTRHTVFVKTGGVMWAVGANDEGQLGDGSQVNSSPFGTNWITPLQIASGIASASAYEDHTRFVQLDGKLSKMGDNGRITGILTSDDLSIAIPMSERTWSSPGPVQLADGVVNVAAGLWHTIYVRSDGTLWATDDNFSGQLGDGTTTSQGSPIQVGSGVSLVSAGALHTMYVKTDASLWAMGWNFHGQLGDGTATERHLPVQVASGVVSVAVSGFQSFFVKTDGTLWATGLNYYGQLGDGTTTSRSNPVQVASGIASVSAGPTHTMFVKSDGTLWAMDYNNAGQLGDGTTTDRHAPVQVASGVAKVAAGGAHTLFVKTNGTLWAMGANNNRQLGDLSATDRTTPVQVASGVASVSAGYSHTVFVKLDGTLWGMGGNSFGQLGPNDRATPILVSMFPEFTTQPVSMAVAAIDLPVTYTAVASGTPTPTYQWMRDGDPISGATGASYTIANVTAGDVGSYAVVATNSAGSAVSNAATLTIGIVAPSDAVISIAVE